MKSILFIALALFFFSLQGEARVLSARDQDELLRLLDVKGYTFPTNADDARARKQKRPVTENDIQYMAHKYDDEHYVVRKSTHSRAHRRKDDDEQYISRRYDDDEQYAARRDDDEQYMSRRDDDEQYMSRRYDDEQYISRRYDDEQYVARRDDDMLGTPSIYIGFDEDEFFQLEPMRGVTRFNDDDEEEEEDEFFHLEPTSFSKLSFDDEQYKSRRRDDDEQYIARKIKDDDEMFKVTIRGTFDEDEFFQLEPMRGVTRFNDDDEEEDEEEDEFFQLGPSRGIFNDDDFIQLKAFSGGPIYTGNPNLRARGRQFSRE